MLAFQPFTEPHRFRVTRQTVSRELRAPAVFDCRIQQVRDLLQDLGPPMLRIGPDLDLDKTSRVGCYYEMHRSIAVTRLNATVINNRRREQTLQEKDDDILAGRIIAN